MGELLGGAGLWGRKQPECRQSGSCTQYLVCRGVLFTTSAHIAARTSPGPRHERRCPHRAEPAFVLDCSSH